MQSIKLPVKMLWREHYNLFGRKVMFSYLMSDFKVN